MQFLINIVGLVLIGCTYWFFFGKKEEEGVMAEGQIDILVKGGYKPAAITVAKGKPVALKFLREDPSACLEEVVIPEFKVRQFLPVGKAVEVVITPTKTGTFAFSCGMNMFHGKLKVV